MVERDQEAVGNLRPRPIPVVPDYDIDFIAYAAGTKDGFNYVLSWTQDIDALRKRITDQREFLKTREKFIFQKTKALSTNKKKQWVQKNKQYLDQTFNPFIQVKINLPNELQFSEVNNIKTLYTKQNLRVLVYNLNAVTIYPDKNNYKIIGKSSNIIFDQNYKQEHRRRVSHFLGMMVHEPIRFGLLPTQNNQGNWVDNILNGKIFLYQNPFELQDFIWEYKALINFWQSASKKQMQKILLNDHQISVLVPYILP